MYSKCIVSPLMTQPMQITASKRPVFAARSAATGISKDPGTRTIEARSSSSGLNVGVYRGGFGGNLSKYEKTPAGKAIRACIMYISEYLTCAMVDKGDCMAEFDAQEASRKAKTKKAIKLD